MDFQQLEADFASHPITGYLNTGERLYVPLISHIEDNLYVGGCINGVDLGDFFSAVFSLYKWEAYKVAPGTNVYTVTMYDSHDGLDTKTVEGVARTVNAALDAGGNVLVHCQAGINRSNLVAATALVRRGRNPEEAVNLLENRRSPLILSNQTFRNHVLSL